MDDIRIGVVDELKRAMPWVAFIAIVAFVIGVLSIVTFVYVVVAGQPGGTESGLSVLILTYGPMVVLYFLLALVLGRYARAIAALQSSRIGDALIQALRLHTQVWRAFAIAVIVFVVFGFLPAIMF